MTRPGQKPMPWITETCDPGQDAAGFLDFYRAHRPALAAAFRRMTDDSRYVDDAVQEALLIARRKWLQLAGYERPEVWVAKVALRILRRWQHDDCERLKLVNSQPAAHPVSRPSPISEHDDLYEAVRALPPRQRQVVVLHYLLGFSIEEVAGILGRAAGTVKAQLHTARGKLKMQLGEGGPA